MALMEAEDIKKRWQEYTELYKGLMTWVTAMLWSLILESEAKWALGNITMNQGSEGDRISAELFWILKDDGVKVLQSICQQIWKTQQQA